jgi:hypothetical protein
MKPPITDEQKLICTLAATVFTHEKEHSAQTLESRVELAVKIARMIVDHVVST